MTCTLVLLGDSQSGKSSLLSRISDNRFDSEMLSTIGVDLRMIPSYRNSIHGEQVTTRLKIWDTAGIEKFRFLLKSYIKSADGIIIVVDGTCKESLRKVSSWYHYIKSCGRITVPIFVAINKMDLLSDDNIYQKDNYSISQCRQELFDNLGDIIYLVRDVFFVSAKSGQNVTNMFHKVGNHCINMQNVVLSKNDVVDNATTHCCFEECCII